MFNVLFAYLVRNLLPTRLRQSRIIAYAKLLISYIDKIYNEYVAYRTIKLYDINFTGQVMYLQKRIRDTFDCQGILIEDGVLSLPFYLSNKDELNLPVFTGNMFILGHQYQAGESIVFENKWYDYISTGSGINPNLEPGTVVTLGDDYEFFLSNQAELSSQNDFIIKIPAVCYNNMTLSDFVEMRAIIEYYKLANKTYTIISY